MKNKTDNLLNYYLKMVKKIIENNGFNKTIQRSTILITIKMK